MILISSNKNPVFKEIISLKNRRDREEKGLYYVEGLRIVEEALNGNADIAGIAISEEFAADSRNTGILSRIEVLKVKSYLFTSKLFKEITDTETPQGILAIMGIRKHELKHGLDKNGLYVIMYSIRDPGNLGTIIRTADAAGFSGVILSKGCVDLYNPKVLRSTMGSVFHIPVYQAGDISEMIKLLKSNTIRILVSHLEGKVGLFETDMSLGAALVIGSEAEGVCEELRASADVLVRIPMFGKAESLNASVAAGVMIYEAVRQRSLKIQH
ncbi:MAG: RNA methyltransferase [Ruminiclostridium sp.]|nr:RNA methyltransferase [Ruminiclostridium sp.]